MNNPRHEHKPEHKPANRARYRMPRWLRTRACTDREKIGHALAGKTLLVTGASSGIGAAAARLLGRPGARLILVARNEARLAAVCRQIELQGGIAHYYCADFTQTGQVLALAQHIAREFPVIDIVISNAGKSIRRNLVDTGLRTQDITRCSQVNYVSPVVLLAHFLPGMIKRGAGQVINVSTVSARLPAAPYWSAYQSSKSAFDVWFQAAGAELRAHGLRFGCVYLPLVHTPMSAPGAVFARVPGMSAEDAAATLAHALLSGRRRIAPWWLWPCEWLSILFRWPLDGIMQALYRRSEARRIQRARNMQQKNIENAQNTRDANDA